MSDKKPLYKQIMDKLKERIKSGDFEYDAPFVTEDRITKEYGVSRITAIRALEELEHDGLINRKRGSGSFVSKNAMSILGKNKEDNAAVTIHKKNRDISLVALVMPFDRCSCMPSSTPRQMRIRSLYSSCSSSTRFT